MASLESSQNNKIFLSIVEGSIRQSVPEGTPDAVKRDWEAGGEKGTKFEKVYKQIAGRITGVDFFDGESKGRKFQNLNLTFDEIDGKTPVLSVGVGSRYAQDILKKLPNVDFAEEVMVRPYAFQPEGEDKTVTGVEIKQKDHTGNFEKKVSSFFHKKEGEKWVAVNGYPVPEGETGDYTSDDWDIFYKQARRFLVNYTKTNISPKLADVDYREPVDREPSEDVNPEDIPF